MEIPGKIGTIVGKHVTILETCWRMFEKEEQNVEIYWDNPSHIYLDKMWNILAEQARQDGYKWGNHQRQMRKN